jgi:protease I
MIPTGTTKSHSLAAKYDLVTDALRASLVGQEVEVPEFAPSNLLDNYRVALLVSHGPELPEFDIPLGFLRASGAIVDVITQDWIYDYQPAAPGVIVLSQFLATNICVKTDMPIRGAVVDNYDAVLTIGGAWNPILLRTDKEMIAFTKRMAELGRLVASICHGPQFLISLQAFPPQTDAIGVDDVVVDLGNAGFNIVQNDVVYDSESRLLTARNPAALGLFCRALEQRLLEQQAVSLKATLP